MRWCTLAAPDKRRPAVVLTRQSATGYLRGLTVAPLTTTIREVPSQVILEPDRDGVPEHCAVNLDNVQTVPQGRIGGLVTSLSPDRLRELEDALCFALGLDDWEPRV